MGLAPVAVFLPSSSGRMGPAARAPVTLICGVVIVLIVYLALPEAPIGNMRNNDRWSHPSGDRRFIEVPVNAQACSPP